MSLLADALQPFFATGLVGVRRRQLAVSIPDLMAGIGKVGFDLSFDDVGEDIIADFRDVRPVLGAMASDCSRFASASFQTILQIPSDIIIRDRTAWSIIQAYYAAFYAGHAILRIFGESCSYFDRRHIDRINKLGEAVGRAPGFRLTATAYHCIASSDSTELRSHKLRDGIGGAHEAFWTVFGKRLKEISENVLTGPMTDIDRQLVFTRLEQLIKNISSPGGPVYSHLSFVRNEVQYRHARDVWLPSSLRREDRDRLARLIEQWSRDPMDVELQQDGAGMLEKFAVTCSFLISVCKCLLIRIKERAPVPTNSFAQLGPLSLLNSVR